MKVLKPLGWSALSAILFVPAALISVVMLPWIPLLARAADALGRRGAQWMGTKVAPRNPNRWFDWQQFYHFLLQLLITAAHFFVWCAMGFTAVLLFIAPLVSKGELAIGSATIENPTIVKVACWLLSIFAVALLIGGAQILTFASIAVTKLTLTPTAEELEASRATLIDAFSGERRRIERELHDGPQQHLTAIKLNLAAAKLHASSPETLAALEAIEHNAACALKALRATVRGISPQVLTDDGLVPALEELVAHTGISVGLEVKGTPTLLDETSALLAYHAVAESLTNATKHGEATNATVHVEFGQDLRITVRDSGKGCPPQAVESSKGTGITGLRERAAALGGTVQLRSSVHRTDFIMTLPIKESA